MPPARGTEFIAVVDAARENATGANALLLEMRTERRAAVAFIFTEADPDVDELVLECGKRHWT